MTDRNEYVGIIEQIKENIRVSRYHAASSVNRELLLLYFSTGKILSGTVKKEGWGAKVLDRISKDIQDEFPGIRGFSVRNLKNMRQFYDNYRFLDSQEIGQLPTAQHDLPEIGQTLSAQIGQRKEIRTELAIRQSPTAQLDNIDPMLFVDIFLKLGFTHHILLLQKCIDIKERFFYMQNAVNFQWSVNVLRYHIESDLYNRKGKMLSNFGETLPIRIRKHAIEAFKDEYLLSFINVNEEDEEAVLEAEIVNNIKKFLMSLGTGFTFIGNQYRLVVGGDEFFIDLLFYHRQLQAMVAIELKNGKFRPEYAGKMNFYLSALDASGKLPHENPSVGIILCREKNGAVVEFAFQDVYKPMGVATYKLRKRLPEHLKGYLPKSEELKKLLTHTKGER